MANAAEVAQMTSAEAALEVEGDRGEQQAAGGCHWTCTRRFGGVVWFASAFDRGDCSR